MRRESQPGSAAASSVDLRCITAGSSLDIREPSIRGSIHRQGSNTSRDAENASKDAEKDEKTTKTVAFEDAEPPGTSGGEFGTGNGGFSVIEEHSETIESGMTLQVPDGVSSGRKLHHGASSAPQMAESERPSILKRAVETDL